MTEAMTEAMTTESATELLRIDERGEATLSVVRAKERRTVTLKWGQP